MGDPAYSLIYTANLSGIYYGHVSIVIDIQSGEVIDVGNSLKGTIPADIPQFDEPKLKSMLMKAYDVIPTYYTPPQNKINKTEDAIIQTNPVTISEDPVKPVWCIPLHVKPTTVIIFWMQKMLYGGTFQRQNQLR